MKTGLSQRLLRPLLAWGPLRRRLAIAIRVFYFGDLDLSLPLSHGLGCPLALQEDDFSFAEIFFNGVYNEVLESIPLPARWLDLGCHAGYFSLWLEWHRRRLGQSPDSSTALLVDADARRLPGLARLLALNGFGTRWNYAHGAICAGSGEHVFYQRSVMASSAAPYAPEPGRPVSVPVLTATQLLERFPPPYDLIKVDIEGAEVDFLTHYEPVWRESRQVLLEWHADSLGSAGVEGLRRRLRDGGFPRLREFGLSPDGASGHLLSARS
jgi:FkbM family methyltransferase